MGQTPQALRQRCSRHNYAGLTTWSTWMGPGFLDSCSVMSWRWAAPNRVNQRNDTRTMSKAKCKLADLPLRQLEDVASDRTGWHTLNQRNTCQFQRGLLPTSHCCPQAPPPILPQGPMFLAPPATASVLLPSDFDATCAPTNKNTRSRQPRLSRDYQEEHMQKKYNFWALNKSEKGIL